MQYSIVDDFEQKYRKQSCIQFVKETEKTYFIKMLYECCCRILLLLLFDRMVRIVVFFSY